MKWGFSENNTFSLYNIYGGNVLSAVKTQVGSLNYLTVKGESDNGASNFKIVLRSGAFTLGPGIYPSGALPVANNLDSFIYNCPSAQYFIKYNETGTWC